MLVSAKSLEELEAKLASIPEEKRRAIVLAGAHRNERTHVLARLHHREWEEFGVVAVNVPFDWTPQGFWANAYEARPKRIRDFFRTRKQRDRVDHERIVMRMAATPWD